LQKKIQLMYSYISFIYSAFLFLINVIMVFFFFSSSSSFPLNLLFIAWIKLHAIEFNLDGLERTYESHLANALGNAFSRIIGKKINPNSRIPVRLNNSVVFGVKEKDLIEEINSLKGFRYFVILYLLICYI